MRILVLTNHLEGTDGWSKVSLDYIQELKKFGHDVLCLTRDNVLADPMAYLKNPFLVILAAGKIQKEINRFSPDIIHFMAEPYALCLPFLKTGKAKTFLTVHGTYSVIPVLLGPSFQKIILAYLSKQYFRRLDGVAAISSYTKNYLLKNYPWLKDKVRVITNGINLEEHKVIDLSQAPRLLRHSGGFGGQAKTQVKKILFVGEVKRRKGILEALSGLKYYKDNFSSNFIYDVVGSYSEKDPYYKGLVEAINNSGLKNNVFFRGRVNSEDLENYYLKSDLFLMTSLSNHYFEGFGLVFLEANTKGTPGIGPKNSGCQDAILDGKTGYLVDPYNPKEIAEKIDLVLNKNSILHQNCLDWAKENDIKIKAKELLAFYGRE